MQFEYSSLLTIPVELDASVLLGIVMPRVELTGLNVAPVWLVLAVRLIFIIILCLEKFIQ